MAPLIIKKSIQINAPSSNVWKILTKPEFTKKYMFDCEVNSYWLEGSTVEWKGYKDLKEIVYVKGKVVNVKPEKHLKYTTFDPHGGLPDIPENYLEVTYDLTSKDDQTLLTITQGDFSKVAEGPERFTESDQGWEGILPQIKLLSEMEEEC